MYHHKCASVQCGTLSPRKHFLRFLIVNLSKLYSIRESLITHFDFCLEKFVSKFLSQNRLNVDFSEMDQFATLVQDMHIVLAERGYLIAIDELLEDLV